MYQSLAESSIFSIEIHPGSFKHFFVDVINSISKCSKSRIDLEHFCNAMQKRNDLSVFLWIDFEIDIDIWLMNQQI